MADEVQGATTDAPNAKRAAMRRATLTLVIAVGVLDTLAMVRLLSVFKGTPAIVA